MKKFLQIALCTFFVMSMAGAAVGDSLKSAIIYDMGGKFDKSFNEGAYRGAELFKKEFGDIYQDFEPINESRYEQAIRRFASSDTELIIVIGFSFRTVLEKLAPEFPKIKFVIVDEYVDEPNVQSIVFKDHEGSFLVGMLAAMKADGGKIGFVGGMDVPLIRKFALGYREGAKYVNPAIEVFQDMTGPTPAAWSDPIKAGELARSQFERGAEVVYAAAGRSSLGVLQAAADMGKFSIGVDSNQNYLHPGSVLTSMIKRVDLAVYRALKAAKEGSWKGGLVNLGLKEDALSWALDKYNEALITPEMKAKVAEAREKIVSGEIIVTNYCTSVGK